MIFFSFASALCRLARCSEVLQARSNLHELTGAAEPVPVIKALPVDALDAGPADSTDPLIAGVLLDKVASGASGSKTKRGEKNKTKNTTTSKKQQEQQQRRKKRRKNEEATFFFFEIPFFLFWVFFLFAGTRQKFFWVDRAERRLFWANSQHEMHTKRVEATVHAVHEGPSQAVLSAVAGLDPALVFGIDTNHKHIDLIAPDARTRRLCVATLRQIIQEDTTAM
jgi:hypothetical protein